MRFLKTNLKEIKNIDYKNPSQFPNSLVRSFWTENGNPALILLEQVVHESRWTGPEFLTWRGSAVPQGDRKAPPLPHGQSQPCILFSCSKRDIYVNTATPNTLAYQASFKSILESLGAAGRRNYLL